MSAKFAFCLVSLHGLIMQVHSITVGFFLPDIILSIHCYYHRGTRLNAIKRSLSLQSTTTMIPPN